MDNGYHIRYFRIFNSISFTKESSQVTLAFFFFFSLFPYFFWFMEHNWQCSRFSPGSMHRNFSQRCSGAHMRCWGLNPDQPQARYICCTISLAQDSSGVQGSWAGALPFSMANTQNWCWLPNWTHLPPSQPFNSNSQNPVTSFHLHVICGGGPSDTI